ncbi:hypothetical protein D6C98_10462 [Aureobasidium pullulans]|uniref:Subtilisin-like serine protease n=1 Tax=Aureobasidium pullulans TaxID=5580 RepID=A0A4S9YV40_AURPU|nr:hypothetical protein D6D23_05671 [Aureobasidium pullulans]THW57767.1 hypothetical protein D6D20_07707 [Aureobasidium pullulans]THY38191.1 hypothetical protein D6C98_10462 [Aureobasidium pullulans]THZ97760.1 hypothetical protein D6C82_06203 [Aureobasidium pullulans]
MDLPFSKNYQLSDEFSRPTGYHKTTSPVKFDAAATLPGYPNIHLADTTHAASFIEKALCARDLEDISSQLWVLTTQSSANINPLHRQKIKGREIVITEDPRLHLVWSYTRIFIQPLPRYLLSHAFWEVYLLHDNSPLGKRRDAVHKAAMGFLRTYHHLIQHESDFSIAQRDDHRLIPKEVTWQAFCQFMQKVSEIQDHEVSGRYHYGEIRLSRLNRYAPLLLHSRYYEQIHGQYAEYFARFYGPMLFVFAVMTTILSSMQVAMAVDQVASHRWSELWPFFRWFSVLGLFSTLVVAAFFVVVWLWMFTDEWMFALRVRFAKKNAVEDVK